MAEILSMLRMYLTRRPTSRFSERVRAGLIMSVTVRCRVDFYRHALLPADQIDSLDKRRLRQAIT